MNDSLLLISVVLLSATGASGQCASNMIRQPLDHLKTCVAGAQHLAGTTTPGSHGTYFAQIHDLAFVSYPETPSVGDPIGFLRCSFANAFGACDLNESNDEGSLTGDFPAQDSDPNFDITHFGGYSNSHNPPTINCTTIAGLNTMKCPGGTADFALGHGVAIPRAGAAPTMSTPTGGRVTPVGLLNGATNWNYKVVAIGPHGELSAASTAFTTNKGAATLGVNTVTISSCSQSVVKGNGVITYTTAAEHNFLAGSKINVVNGSTGNSQAEGAFTIFTTPTARTFTVLRQEQPVVTCPNGGKVSIVAKNLLTWTIQPYAAIGYLVYRSQGTGAYSLVGHTQGMDSAFIDWGTNFTVSNQAAYIPTTPPTSATNGIFASYIIGINGATITMKDKVTQTVAHTLVLHDNEPNLKLACASMPTNAGGTVYFPYPQMFVFNSSVQASDCHQGVKFQFAFLTMNQPWIANYEQVWEGLPSNFGGQVPSFALESGGYISGNAYPLFLITPGSTSGNTFRNFTAQIFRSYQTVFYHDQDQTGNNSTSFLYDRVWMQGACGTVPIHLAGGFGFTWNLGGVSLFGSCPGNSSWGFPAGFTDSTNIGSGNTGQQLASIIRMNTVNLNTEMAFDSYGLAPTAGPGNIVIDTPLSESSTTQSMTFNTGDGPVAFMTIRGGSFADSLTGFGTPVFDFTNTNVLAGCGYRQRELQSRPDDFRAGDNSC
jgi:chitodextrinase